MTDTPNEVHVNEDGCSCFGYCRTCSRSDSDPACPRHGEPLRPDDGDVTICYPDGTEVVLPPPGLFPQAAEHVEVSQLPGMFAPVPEKSWCLADGLQWPCPDAPQTEGGDGR